MKYIIICIYLLSLLCGTPVKAQRQMEKLGRGLVAFHKGNDSVYIGWRLLGTDPEDIGFNLYRKTGKNVPVKLNTTLLTQTTDFTDTRVDLDLENTYTVKPVINGNEQESATPYRLAPNALPRQFL
jgi:rhamnogalacturonan endolyase